jgi:uncharacterized protein
MVKNLRTSLVLLALACAGPVLAASPTPHQVYEALRAGQLTQADQMIKEALKEHPTSGEAHYVAAEVYAREGNFGEARQELATAQTIAPGLPFAKPGSVAELQRELSPGRPATGGFVEHRNSQVHSALPWGMILIVVAVIAVLWAIMRRRSAAAVYQQYGGGPVVAGGAPPGYGPGPVYGPGYGGGPGMGSGIAGGLASGLAVGAGVVAGEELARHFLDRDGNPVPAPSGNEYPSNPNADMGGNDFGLNDGNSWDDGGSGGDSGGGGGDDWT